MRRVRLKLRTVSVLVAVPLLLSGIFLAAANITAQAKGAELPRAVATDAMKSAITSNPTEWRDRGTLRCLDSNTSGSAYTGPVPCGDETGNLFQTWYVIANSDGSYGIRDVATGRCLDSNGSGSAYTNPCQAANTYQHWYLLYNSYDDSYGIKDVATGRCLDSNDAGSVYTNPCQALNSYQHWGD